MCCCVFNTAAVKHLIYCCFVLHFRNTYRCLPCLSDLSKTALLKAKEWSDSEPCTEIEAIRLFLQVDWALLNTECKDIMSAKIAICEKGLDGDIEVCPASNSSRGFCLQFKRKCPSCFNYKFHDPLPALPSHLNYAGISPVWKEDKILLNNIDLIGRHGVIEKKSVSVTVVTVNAVIDDEQVKLFKKRASDEEEHRRVKLFHTLHEPMRSSTQTKEPQKWFLLRSAAKSTGRPSQMLSAVHIGALDSIMKVHQQVGSFFVTVLLIFI